MTRVTREYFDHSTGKLHIQHTEDVEPILEENLRDRNSGLNGFSKGRTWRRIGRIPMIIIEKVLREEGINLMDSTPEARKRVRQYLRDNNKFMTVDKL